MYIYIYWIVYIIVIIIIVVVIIIIVFIIMITIMITIIMTSIVIIIVIIIIIIIIIITIIIIIIIIIVIVIIIIMYIIIYIWSMLLSLRVRDSAKKRKTWQVLLRRAWLSCCICCCNVRRCSSDFLDSYAPHPGLELGLRSKPIGNHPLATAHSLAIWSHNSPFSVGISPKLAGKMMTNHDQPWPTIQFLEYWIPGRVIQYLSSRCPKGIQVETAASILPTRIRIFTLLHIATEFGGWNVYLSAPSGLAPPPSLSVSLATVLPGSKLSSHLTAQLVTRLTSSILLMGQIHYENLSIDSDHTFFNRAPKIVHPAWDETTAVLIPDFRLERSHSKQISEIETLGMKNVESMDHRFSAMNANGQVALRALFSWGFELDLQFLVLLS